MNKNNILINKGERSQIVDKIFLGNMDKSIVLEADSHLKYLILSYGSQINLDFSSLGTGCCVDVYTLFFSKNKEEIVGNISVNLQNHHCKANVYMLSLMGDDSIIQVKGNIDIKAGISGVVGYLLEENIVLGEKIKINTLPILNVSSNDVSAGHGAKIQKLDSDKLFYMMSKGLSDSKSKEIIIRGYIHYIFEKFVLSEEELLELENIILNYLLKIG